MGEWHSITATCQSNELSISLKLRPYNCQLTQCNNSFIQLMSIYPYWRKLLGWVHSSVQQSIPSYDRSSVLHQATESSTGTAYNFNKEHKISKNACNLQAGRLNRFTKIAYTFLEKCLKLNMKMPTIFQE